VFPGDGSNDFSDVKRRTGVDIGIMSISSGLDTLLSLKNKITNDIYTGGHVILTRNHLKKQNKYGVLFAVQSRVAPNWQLHGDARTIEEWFDAGLRVLQLQYGTKEKHDSSERLGYGTSEGDDKGLTDLGKKVVKKMNSLGMIIDVAHSNRQTTLDAAALSTFPIIATHANAESLTPINRNKSDEELVAIADTGGVICVTTIRWMLDTNKDNKAGLEDFILHIEYMVDLVGLDHVGVATDADMSGWEKSSTHYASKELASFNRWKLLAQKLHEKGWSDEQLEKLLGGNLRRVFVGGKITTHTLKQVESPPPDNINHQFQLMIDIAKTTPGPVTQK
jgi:microsomal dipeptidase-like Zn-dependent dipeptidase